MVEHGNRSANALKIRGIKPCHEKCLVFTSACMHNAVGPDGRALADITIVSSACTDDEPLVLYGTR